MYIPFQATPIQAYIIKCPVLFEILKRAPNDINRCRSINLLWALLVHPLHRPMKWTIDTSNLRKSSLAYNWKILMNPTLLHNMNIIN